MVLQRSSLLTATLSSARVSRETPHFNHVDIDYGCSQQLSIVPAIHKDSSMTDTDQPREKIHYICQTYVVTEAGRDEQTGLKVAKQFEYSTAPEAQNRAEREALSDNCVGADAYMVVEDPKSGEVGEPSFLIRLGNVPEFDDF